MIKSVIKSRILFLFVFEFLLVCFTLPTPKTFLGTKLKTNNVVMGCEGHPDYVGNILYPMNEKELHKSVTA